MRIRNISDSDAVVLRKEREREKLKRFARKITKVPSSFNTPIEYIVGKRERET